MRAPEPLRFVLVTRHDMRMGLHRLRLEGELTEIRADDLRFTLAEAQALFQAAGVELAGPAVAALHQRTEGWVAGLRLAALSLAGAPESGRLRHGVLRERPDGGGIPAGRGAGPAERRGQAAAVADLGAGAGQRGAGRSADGEARAGNGCCRIWRRRTRSSCRWMRAGRGSAITACSSACCSWSCAGPSRVRWPDCTELAAGWFAGHGFASGGGPARARRGRTGTRPPGCWPFHSGGPEPGRPQGHGARAAGRVPGRGPVPPTPSCGRGRGRRAGRGVAAGGGTLPQAGGARAAVSAAQPARQAEALLGESSCCRSDAKATSGRAPSRRSGCSRRPRRRPREAGKSCVRWRCSRSATPRRGSAASTRRRVTWTRPSRWRAGSVAVPRVHGRGVPGADGVSRRLPRAADPAGRPSI